MVVAAELLCRTVSSWVFALRIRLVASVYKLYILFRASQTSAIVIPIACEASWYTLPGRLALEHPRIARLITVLFVRAIGTIVLSETQVEIRKKS